MADNCPTLAIVTDLGAPSDREWKFQELDRDDIDTLPEKLGATIDLDCGLDSPLQIKSIHDLSPERLVAGIPKLAGLLQAREAAGNDDAVRRLAAEAGADRELQALLDQRDVSTTPPTATDSSNSEDSRAALEAMLEQTPGPPSANDFANRIVQQALSSAPPADSAAEERHEWAIDQILGAHLRAILQGTAFKRLETAWRGLRRLIMGSPTGSDLRIVVLPAPTADIQADLAAHHDGDPPGRLELCIESARDKWGPIDAVFLEQEFGPQEQDIVTLVGLGLLAGRLNLPAIAAATPALAGLQQVIELGDHRAVARGAESAEVAGWRQLRESPVAEHLGLCLPRLLLRVPFGPATRTVDGFNFDELAGTAAADRYLWGNPALDLALVIARALESGGRGTHPAPWNELTSLPAHVYDDDGETVTLGPAEVVLPDVAAAALAASGFMPIQVIRGTHTARFAAIQSVAGTTLLA